MQYAPSNVPAALGGAMTSGRSLHGVAGIAGDAARRAAKRRTFERDARHGAASRTRINAVRTAHGTCKSLETKQTMGVCNETPGPS